MYRNLFWLSDEQWRRIEPRLPTDVRGVERQDDRRIISGIIHVLKSGCRCSIVLSLRASYDDLQSLRSVARRGIWENLFRELAGNGRLTDPQMIDFTHVKAHRSASGGKGEQKQAVGRSRRGRNTKIHALAMLGAPDRHSVDRR